MSYKNAEKILPMELVELLQKYIDGEFLYIPRKESSRKAWGEGTNIRKEIAGRNIQILEDYATGLKTSILAEKYFLSEKSIQRIVSKMKKSV